MNESKHLLRDIDAVRRELLQAGWHKTDLVTETDLYYETPDGKLGRVRTCGSFTEIRVEGEDPQVMSVPFQVEAFREATDGWPSEAQARVEKTRAMYVSDSFPGTRIDLDILLHTGHGAQMYVKVRSEFDPYLIEQLETKLGLDRLEKVDVPYRELVVR